MAEKKQRQEEYQIIQREREMLEGERRQLEPMLESVKELMAYGTTLEVLKSYINMIENKAVAECIDPKTAANNLLTSSPWNGIKEQPLNGDMQSVEAGY